ncbi:HD domain-containing protein [Candidatus Dojkabacteria bacterium]|jgi:hypothetical protein|nr:HD domain-containing protein [Candidatus Dojkabacteria bacterium]
MKISDKIYGEFEITEPVLLEIIASKPLQRLKDISQQGVPEKYYKTIVYSRYEHSVGVMLLLMHLGASIEEQIAGLIHDISHTVFSHVIDYLDINGKINEDLQDLRHYLFVKNSDVSEIIERYHLDFDRISVIDKNRLLDRPIPYLCADRIDYLIRYFPTNIAKRLFSKLNEMDGKIIFKDFNSAKRFAEFFLEKQVNVWGGYNGNARYILLAEILKIALKEGTILSDDLFKEETEVLGKLLKCGSSRINYLFSLLKKDNLENLPRVKTPMSKKFRYVDPEYLDGKIVKTLSKTDKDFKALLTKSKLENAKGIYIPDMAKI